MAFTWGGSDPACIEIVPGSPLLEAEFDGEMVGLSLEQDGAFGFNRSASFIWSQLKAPITLTELVARVRARFEVDEATCLQDVSALLNQLEQHGLLTLRRAHAD